MPRERKENVPISIRMDKDTYEKLIEFCSLSGQPKTVAIERAVSRYVDDNIDRFSPTRRKEE